MQTEELDKAVERILQHAKKSRSDEAWRGVESLLRVQGQHESVALALTYIVENGQLSIEKSLEVLAALYEAHSQNPKVLAAIGQTLDRACDIDFLNRAPPAAPLFQKVVEALRPLCEHARDTPEETPLLEGLATAARMMGRQHDEIVERCSKRLIELHPHESHRHYNYGLFLKTRGRFREGMAANQRSRELKRGEDESVEWNLGICATGAGEGAAALEVWQRMKQVIKMGRFELPDGRYAQCKVRLAERPLAARSADADDPGLEETIWIERLSPAHGIIRSVLYNDLGVDYGDVVLIDGAPITYHTYGDKQVPVFPHLATLHRRHYRLFNFAGTQESARQLAGAEVDLDGDTVVYSHSEQFSQVCAQCWRNPEIDHHHDEKIDQHVVTGRIAASRDVDPGELLSQLDRALSKREPCRIYVPDLCEAAGLTDRAAFERRRYAMIANR